MVESAKVLIIDDDEVMLDVLEVMIAQRGYTCVRATSYENAMESVKRNNFAFIIADIFMAGMGGIEGIRQIKRLDPFIPVMAVSGGWDSMSAEKTVEAAQAVGADTGLAKPFSTESFTEAFDRLRESSIT
ncbi:MAG: response regulator [Rhodospirillales bacterium]